MGFAFFKNTRIKTQPSKELSFMSLTMLSSCCLSFGSREGSGHGSTSTSSSCSWLLPQRLCCAQLECDGMSHVSSLCAHKTALSFETLCDLKLWPDEEKGQNHCHLQWRGGSSTADETQRNEDELVSTWYCCVPTSDLLLKLQIPVSEWPQDGCSYQSKDDSSCLCGLLTSSVA